MIDSELTPVDYQLSIDDNDPPDEMFDSDQPTDTAIHESLRSSNVSVCAAGCVVTSTCSRLLVAGTGVSVAEATVAIANAYVAANAPSVTSSDVCVNVTGIESTVDQSGYAASFYTASQKMSPICLAITLTYMNGFG